MPRVPIFTEKVFDLPHKRTGYLTEEGAQGFEEKRDELAIMSNRNVEGVSDGDVMESMIRGKRATLAYIRLKGRTSK